MHLGVDKVKIHSVIDLSTSIPLDDTIWPKIMPWYDVEWRLTSLCIIHIMYKKLHPLFLKNCKLVS